MTAVDGGSETVLTRPIDQIRAAFPGLSDGRAALDGAAGTQLPAPVIDAMVAAMRDAMANVHGVFPDRNAVPRRCTRHGPRLPIWWAARLMGCCSART